MWFGMAGLGLAIAADGSTEPRKRFPAALFGEQTRRVSVGTGVARQGPVCRGNSCRRQHGALRCSLLLSLEGRCGRERHGQVRPGLARRGAVMVADSSTELRKKFPAAFFGGQTGLGSIRSGQVRQC